MVTLKVLILAIPVIISLSKSEEKKISIKQEITSNAFKLQCTNDTVTVLQPQYQIGNKDEGYESLRIEIIDIKLFETLRNSISPIIRIEFKEKFIIAKGINVVSSFGIKECDYFYSLDNNSKPIFYWDRTIYLKKTPQE